MPKAFVAPRSRTVAKFPRARFEKFCEVVRIASKDYGNQPLRLLGGQRFALDEICKGLDEGISEFVILKSRQIGMTTLILVLDIFWAMEHAGLLAAFATHNDQNREKSRAILEMLFAHLPATHKVGVRIHNRMMMILKNGSQLDYLVAGTKEKSRAGLGRGGGANYLHATEVAEWGNEKDINELRVTMSTHYPHRLQIIESTANGFNFFNDLWEDAKSSKVARAIFVGWWRDERYAFPQTDQRYLLYMPEGEETRLSPLERKRVRLVKELYDFDISREQIAWYRWQLEDQQSSDQSHMDELYPWTEGDAFVASGSSFFSNESLTDAMRIARRTPYMAFDYRFGDKWSDTIVVDAGKHRERAHLRVYEAADPLGVYTLGCDPAYGSSDDADRTVISIDRCFADRQIQVAEFCSNSVLTYHCAWALCHLAGYYHNVMAIVEVTGPGTAVFQEMQTLKRGLAAIDSRSVEGRELRDVLAAMVYFLYKRPDSMRGDLAFQWKTNADNKHGMLTAFRDSFQLGRAIVSSSPCLEEMKSIVNDAGQIYAEGSKKDDRVIAKGLSHEAWKRWIQPGLQARGLTYASHLKRLSGEKGDQAMTMATRHLDYLRNSKIKVG
jgi:hypothetical protein